MSSRREVFVVCGTRPEAIKLAPVIAKLREHDEMRPFVVTSGQHRELLDDALDAFSIRADRDLRIMTPNQLPSDVAAAILTGLTPLLDARRPAWVVVQGDTTTAAAAAWAACYARVRIAHVEAGLRSYDRAHPFPEESNRVVVSHLADLHCAPTPRARDNLLREGISQDAIEVTGNTVIDALLEMIGRGWKPAAESALARLPAERRVILVTTHRRESFGEALGSICAALVCLAHRGDVEIVVPLHPNPQVESLVRSNLENVRGITLVPALDYRSFTWLMGRATFILTDSGGVQEEAPSLGKPVLVLRDVTERPEAVEAGSARVVGTQKDRIVSEAVRLLDDQIAYASMAHVANPFGDGMAAPRIVTALAERMQSAV